MKVLFDHQSFTGVSYGGVSRYFFELMRSFTKWSDIEFELSLRLSNNEYLDQTSFSSHLRYRSLAQVRNVHKIASVLNRQYSLRRVKAGKFDVFHPTYYHKYFLDAIGKKPFVLTFHDATSERYGKQYPEVGEGLYELKKQLMRRADSIISVSEFSKQEILRFFPIEPEKIKVIPLGTTLGESISTDKLLPPLQHPICSLWANVGYTKTSMVSFGQSNPCCIDTPIYTLFVRAVEPSISMNRDCFILPVSPAACIIAL